MTLIFFLKPIYRDTGGSEFGGESKSKKRKRKKILEELIPKPIIEMFDKGKKVFLEKLVEQELQAWSLQKEINGRLEFERQVGEDITILELLGEL